LTPRYLAAADKTLGCLIDQERREVKVKPPIVTRYLAADRRLVIDRPKREVNHRLSLADILLIEGSSVTHTHVLVIDIKIIISIRFLGKELPVAAPVCIFSVFSDFPKT